MATFLFILGCITFIVALVLLIYWIIVEDAEECLYQCVGSCIYMSFVNLMLLQWGNNVFSDNIVKWIVFALSIVVILAVVVSIWSYIANSFGDYDLSLLLQLIPVLVSLLAISYLFYPDYIKPNLTKIICVVVTGIFILIIFLIRDKYEKRVDTANGQIRELKYLLRYNCIDSTPYLLSSLNKAELFSVENAITNLYIMAQSKRLSVSSALDVLQKEGISSELIHKIMERLYTDDLLERCSILTLAEFLQELLPELFKSRNNYRSSSMDIRYYENFYEGIRNSISNENSRAIEELNKKIDYLHAYITKNLKSETKNAISAETYGRQNQIKELFHALETPIATSEMALENLKSSFDSLTEMQVMRFERIHNAIKLIKSILFAYRELTFMHIYSDENTFFSLPDIIESIPSLVTTDNLGIIVEQRNLPDQIPKYSTNLIVVLLLPLIHNAFEASPDSSSVLIEYHQSEADCRIVIQNFCKQTPSQKNLNTEGYSSKGNNHVGTGISIVRRISKSAGIDFEIRVNNNKVLAILTFPNR